MPILLLRSHQVFIKCSVWLSALTMWMLEPTSPQAYQCSDWLGHLAHYPHVRLQFSILSWCQIAISHINLRTDCNFVYYPDVRLPFSIQSWCITVISHMTVIKMCSLRLCDQKHLLECTNLIRKSKLVKFILNCNDVIYYITLMSDYHLAHYPHFRLPFSIFSWFSILSLF